MDHQVLRRSSPTCDCKGAKADNIRIRPTPSKVAYITKQTDDICDHCGSYVFWYTLRTNPEFGSKGHLEGYEILQPEVKGAARDCGLIRDILGSECEIY